MGSWFARASVLDRELSASLSDELAEVPVTEDHFTALQELARRSALVDGNLNHFVRLVTEKAVEVLDLDRASVWLESPEISGTLLCADMFVRATCQHVDGGTFVPERYPSYRDALDSEVAIAASDISTDFRTKSIAAQGLSAEGVKALLDAPIRLAGKVIGVVGLEYFDTPRRWSASEQRFASSLAEMIALAQVVKQTKDIAAELKRAEQRYRSIFENAVEGFFQTSPDGHYLTANPALARIYGFESPEQLISGYTDIGAQLYVAPGRREDFVRQMERQGQVTGFESQVYRANGEVIWISESVRAVRDETGEIAYYEGTVEDISARKRAEEKAYIAAHNDGLTGLGNRTWLVEQLKLAMMTSPSQFSLAIIGLDRFKRINLALGQQMGDHLLKAISERIRARIPAEYSLARLGGDQFAVILPFMTKEERVLALFDRMIASFEEPFFLTGVSEVYVSASVGFVCPDGAARDPDQIIRAAGNALREAKAKGGQQIIAYRKQEDRTGPELLRLENALRRAIKAGSFQMFYQPIFQLDRQEVVGVEALVRWRASDRILPPEMFIPLAEKAGLMPELGAWIIRCALGEAMFWTEQQRQPIFAVINISVRQLQRPDFAEMVIKQLEWIKFPPELLRLDISEAALLTDQEVVHQQLLALRAAGIGIYLDKFGAGTSSFGQVLKAPITGIKIDRSFINQLDQAKSKKAVVQSMVTLAQGLGLETVAVGLESEGELETLKSLSCTLAQGYHLSPPLDRHQFQNFLQGLEPTQP